MRTVGDLIDELKHYTRDFEINVEVREAEIYSLEEIFDCIVDDFDEGYKSITIVFKEVEG